MGGKAKPLWVAPFPSWDPGQYRERKLTRVLCLFLDSGKEQLLHDHGPLAFPLLDKALDSHLPEMSWCFYIPQSGDPTMGSIQIYIGKSTYNSADDELGFPTLHCWVHWCEMQNAEVPMNLASHPSCLHIHRLTKEEGQHRLSKSAQKSKGKKQLAVFINAASLWIWWNSTMQFWRRHALKVLSRRKKDNRMKLAREL